MCGLDTLIVRKSRSSWTYFLNLAFGAAFLGFGIALFARWPAISDLARPERDYYVGSIALFAGLLSLIVHTIRPFFDRAPLMIMNADGISARETGARPVPWSEITNCYFEKVQEGRSSYWYFFFTQTDSATGMRFENKISADEFDQANEDVMYVIGKLQETYGKQHAIKPRPPSITADTQGEMLRVGYSRRKEMLSIALYWGLALLAMIFSGIIDLTQKLPLSSLLNFFEEPSLLLEWADTWMLYVWAGAAALALFASFFRLRDLLLRGEALLVDRKGIFSPDLGERAGWEEIAAIRFEPGGSLHLTVTSGPLMGERFININRLVLGQQEVFDGVAWLLNRFKVRFAPMPEVPSGA